MWVVDYAKLCVMQGVLASLVRLTKIPFTPWNHILSLHPHLLTHTFLSLTLSNHRALELRGLESSSWADVANFDIDSLQKELEQGAPSLFRS